MHLPNINKIYAAGAYGQEKIYSKTSLKLPPLINPTLMLTSPSYFQKTQSLVSKVHQLDGGALSKSVIQKMWEFESPRGHQPTLLRTTAGERA